MAKLPNVRPMSRLRCDLCRDSSQEVSEGTRTPDRLDHNQELYQLSYAHRVAAESTSARPRQRPALAELDLEAGHDEDGPGERPRQDSNLRPTA